MKCTRVLQGIAVITACWLVGATQVVLAEDDLPKSGLLAGSATGGYGSTSLPGRWGEGQEGGAPVSASCSKSADEWKVKLFNNSEDKFRVSVRVVQTNLSNKKVGGTTVSGTLAPGANLERTVRMRPNAEHCQVKLSSWKRFKTKKSEEELQEELAAAEKKLDMLRGKVGGDTGGGSRETVAPVEPAGGYQP